jgi:uncharacterized C2H2 Zn-finger protein
MLAKKSKSIKSKTTKEKTVDIEAKLWKQFSIYIRVRDADENGIVKCISCGKLFHWSKTDAGHGIGRQHLATKYHEQNNHAQCRKDNRYEEGKKEAYAKEVDKRYGAGTWNKLLVLSKSTVKRLSQFQIDVLTIHYKNQSNEIKAEKGLL